MKEKKYYLAYGSNLNMEQMMWRCPDAKPVGCTEIKDNRLVFKGSQSGSYLTIETKEGCSVPVGIWEVSDSDEKRLDRYEGYPTFYYKGVLPITFNPFDGGKPKNIYAFVYIMHEDRPYGIPSSTYMRTCRIGYKDFGFDEEVLGKALEDTKEEMK